MTSFELVRWPNEITSANAHFLKSSIYQFNRAHKFIGNESIEIRVFQGAKEMGNQWIPFHQATEILDLSAGVKIVYLSCHDVNKNHMTEEDIIHWLSLGDIHFILTHIHQGICSINAEKLYSMLYRELRIHPGFPLEESLRCPVFTQDKFVYLDALMHKGLCNPTFKVVFKKNMDFISIRQLLKS
jgi:hypothetical protein